MMVFDDNLLQFTSSNFPEFDWLNFYGDVTEAIPSNALEPCGNPVLINVFVDANHTGNLVTRCSHSSILIYLNQALISWYSEAQRTVKTLTFDSEFIALRIAVELLVEALRYKVRMMGVPIDGSANIFGNNKSVIVSATVPSSTLIKRHNAICYHRVREAVASKIIRITYIPSDQNLAYMLTKPLNECKLHERLKNILFQMGWLSCLPFVKPVHHSMMISFGGLIEY
jgi:hypothetical protein